MGDDLVPALGPRVAEAVAQWPDTAAEELVRLYQGLTAEKKKKRLPLSEALVRLATLQVAALPRP